MDNVVYITNDLDVDIEDSDVEVGVDISGVTFSQGGMPAGGDIGDIIVKTSQRDYYAEWMSLREAGLTHIYYDTTANWNSQVTMVSEMGAIYIYSDYITSDTGVIPAVKIGDGSAFLIDLPFTSSDYIDKLYDHINNNNIHTSSVEKNYWNNKVAPIIDSNDAENLILTTDYIT